jgi:hypothetical protein
MSTRISIQELSSVEQLGPVDEEEKVGQKADVFSFGVMLWLPMAVEGF